MRKKGNRERIRKLIEPYSADREKNKQIKKWSKEQPKYDNLRDLLKYNKRQI